MSNVIFQIVVQFCQFFGYSTVFCHRLPIYSEISELLKTPTPKCSKRGVWGVSNLKTFRLGGFGLLGLYFVTLYTLLILENILISSLFQREISILLFYSCAVLIKEGLTTRENTNAPTREARIPIAILTNLCFSFPKRNFIVKEVTKYY